MARARGFFTVLFLPSPVPVFRRWCSHNSCGLSPAPLWRPVSALGSLLLAGVLGCEHISSPPPLAGTCCLGLGGGSSPSPVADALLCVSAGSGKQGAVLASSSRSLLCTPTPPPRAAGLSCPSSFCRISDGERGCVSSLCAVIFSFILERLINCMFSFISSFSLMVSFLIHGLFRSKFHIPVGFFPPYIFLVVNSSLILLFSESVLC